MSTVFYYLLALGVMGVFDIVYYHTYVCELYKQPSSRVEHFIHKLRYPIYLFLFIYVANFNAKGVWVFLPAAFLLLDSIIAFWDISEEPRSRERLGGMPKGEYILHFIFALLLGAFYHSFVMILVRDFHSPSSLKFAPPQVSVILRIFMSYLGFRAIFLTFSPIKIPTFLSNLFERIKKASTMKLHFKE